MKVSVVIMSKIKRKERVAEIIELVKKGYVLYTEKESFTFRNNKFYWWRPGLIDDEEFKIDFEYHLEMLLCTSKGIIIDGYKMSIEIC